MRKHHPGTWLFGVALLAVTLAACGDSESSSDPTTAPTSGSSTTAAPTTTTQAPPDADAPVLDSTSWDVIFYQLPTGSMTNLWPGTEILLNFGAGGTIDGFSGCNQYSGSFAVDGPYDEFVSGTRDPNDGQLFSVSSLSFTERACASPSGVMEQETEYLDALQNAARWLIGGDDHLFLRNAEGFFLIEAEPIA